MLTALVVLVAILLVPGSAFAVGDLPDEMVDPVGAMEPEIDVAEPIAGGQVQADAVPIVDGADPAPDATPGPAPQAAAGATPSPNVQAPVGSGTLPFTGPEPGLLTLLFLVGTLTLAAGVTAFVHARAISETD